MPDHIHLLFLQHPSRSIAEIVRKIKGRSSFWINQSGLCTQKFGWHPGYAAFAVSESQVPKVFDYIDKQQAHHLKESFQQEFNHLVALHGLSPVV